MPNKRPEVDYGYRWTIDGRPGLTWRVSWDPETGMLYAYQPGNVNEPAQLVHLCAVRTKKEADALMGNWANPNCHYHQNIFRLRVHCCAAGDMPAKINIRFRRKSDHRKWEEIPVSVRLYCDDQPIALHAGNRAAQWLINKSTNDDDRIVEVRFNMNDSSQGHYVSAPVKV